jgi:replicative DNA helicase
MNEDEFGQLHDSVTRLAELPIFVDDTPALNIFELRAKSRRLKQNHNIQLIIIDYLQLMAGAPNQSNGSREQEISSISRALKGMAKELNVPVIALSQLSRAVETRGGDKKPQLSDLRESGAIEQDADIVTFIYRPDYYELSGEDFDIPKDQAEIIIAKHRNGSLGSVYLKFIPHFVKFTEPDDSDDLSFGSDDPFGGGIITRPSRMNEQEEESPF